MGGLAGFLLGYIIGGLTLLPLIVIGVLIHAYLTFPINDDRSSQERCSSSIVQPGDDVEAIKFAEKSLVENFRPSGNHEAEVAAGYFAVCREYVPGGVNGKPPERTTPVGSTTVSAPSPSVYQSMYRSIFDRKQSNNPLDNKAAGKSPRRGGNVFYVVLRHGHLMLFDDDEQLEVRHVISLAHHVVSIYSGGDETPEGELFIKRNALCLSRRVDTLDITPDGIVSKPFYLFSENCSFKEDFYFALLRNQERVPGAPNNPPLPLPYEVSDIITLVQRLHSSEEHLQTRWINAVIGRIFLALYKTPEMENFFRSRITKKISRVKTPSFLSKISLRNIDMGNAAPVITNPRLKDLTVDGELVVEGDIRYTGNLRIEVATTARIDLGSRFKAREVNLVLAVVVKRLEGHGMIRIKPPPSNRLWISFATMPKVEMTIEPIVSSRQITYTLILRQIENRIKEVIAESLVYPNWDDIPFYNSDSKKWRGGIWVDEEHPKPQVNAEEAATQEGDVEEVQHLEGDTEELFQDLPQVERSISMPVMESSTPVTAHARKAAKSAMNLVSGKSTGVSSSVETRTTEVERPRALRSGSLAAASTPVVATDVTTVDAFKPSSPPDVSHAASAMAAISALSQSASPPQTPVGSPSRPPNYS
ncbi:DNA-directed DNA polymerase, partial [Scytalidium lignicola]